MTRRLTPNWVKFDNFIKSSELKEFRKQILEEKGIHLIVSTHKHTVYVSAINENDGSVYNTFIPFWGKNDWRMPRYIIMSKLNDIIGRFANE